MQKCKIAVVIPCYKVEETILQVIEKISPMVDLIIVVNDASLDATAEIVKGIADERITLITFNKNQGVGGAMKTGYAYALSKDADIIVKVDGDGQMDSKYLTKLIEPILAGEADYTKGNRFLYLQELKHMPLIRRIGNFGLTFLTKAASGYWNIFDPTNGFTAITSEILRNLQPKQIANNYFFETSMLCNLRLIDAIVQDVSIPAIYQGEKSSLNILPQLLIFPFNLLLRMSKRLAFRYFLYDFNVASFYIIAGVILLIFGFIWGIVKWSQSIQTGIPSTTGTVLIAVLPFILGVQFLTQAVAIDINDIPFRKNKKISRFASEKGINSFESYLDRLLKESLIIIEKVSVV